MWYYAVILYYTAAAAAALHVADHAERGEAVRGSLQDVADDYFNDEVITTQYIARFVAPTLKQKSTTCCEGVLFQRWNRYPQYVAISRIMRNVAKPSVAPCRFRRTSVCNIYIYIYTYTHIHIHIFLFFCYRGARLHDGGASRVTSQLAKYML